MKKRIAYLIVSALLFSITTFGQSQESKSTSSKSSGTAQRDKVDSQRIIRLEKDSKPKEIIITIKKRAREFNIMISSSVTHGKLSIEIYDPNNEKQGNYTVGTQINNEMVKGRIQKSLNLVDPGDWKIKIIPSEATGEILVETVIVELH